MLILIKFQIIFLLSLLNIDWIKLLPILLPVILSVAFFTVFERKVLAAMQRRRGPNVVGLYGLLQAFADGLKLLAKETNIPSSANLFIFILAPIFTFMLSLLGWSIMPFSSNIVVADIPLGMLVVFAISSLGVYGIILSGWASNSKYAFLGGLRSSAQMISYEVSIGLLVMPVIFLAGTANLSGIVLAQKYLYFCFPLFPSCILFFISILAETNRLPFDLPEAESELVSGFNVEYSSVTFTLFFLAEYSSIILMSSLYVVLFFGGWLPFLNLNILYWIPGWVWFSFKVILIMFLYVWVRATLPRYRFDQLMSLGWKVILPLSLGFFMFTVSLFLFYFSFMKFYYFSSISMSFFILPFLKDNFCSLNVIFINNII